MFFHSLNQCHSIADLRKLAAKKLPRAIFDYLDGGAEDEITLGNNSENFRNYQFIPKTLVDVSEIKLQTNIQGAQIDLPILFSPIGGARIFHHLGEKAVAPMADKYNTIYSLSTMSTHSIEEVSGFTNAPKWFQIYVWKDRSLVKDFIDRCKANGYSALCLTVDSSTSGKRERDLVNGMTIPPKFSLSSILDIGMHPAWWTKVLTSQKITFSNFIGKAGPGSDNAAPLSKFVAEQLDPAVTWDDMAWMIEQWGGPFLIKGVLSPADAIKAVEVGASGIIISNHGGRQLDHAATTIDMLPDIAEAVENRAQVILDSGIRRGSDVIKALALGADACMIGRAGIYGLAAGGQDGVDKAMTILKDEMTRSMQLLGCPDIHQLDKSYIKSEHLTV